MIVIRQRKPCATCGKSMSVRDQHRECYVCRTGGARLKATPRAERECVGCGRPLSARYPHHACGTCRGEAHVRPEPPEACGHESRAMLADLDALVRSREPSGLARWWR